MIHAMYMPKLERVTNEEIEKLRRSLENLPFITIVQFEHLMDADISWHHGNLEAEHGHEIDEAVARKSWNENCREGFILYWGEKIEATGIVLNYDICMGGILYGNNIPIQMQLSF